MAKIEGAQSIPSELKELYDGTITPKSGVNIVRRRYPWRKPNKQLGGYSVTVAEKAQRQRWLDIIAKFKTVDLATRQRWFAALPPWATNLWYFNYFQMSGLKGNAVIGAMEGGLIKDINHYTFTLPNGTPQPVTVTIDECDPTKVAVFFAGAGWKEILSNFAISVFPYLVSLHSTYLVVQGSLAVGENAACGCSVIEYI